MASKTIAEYKADWTAADNAYKNAKTEAERTAAQQAKDEARAGAENLRSQYGNYSGGEDGSAYKETDASIDETITANGGNSVDIQKGNTKQDVAEDGLYGAKTQAAVTAYQKAKGLKTDGIVGNETAASLGLLNDGKSNSEWLSYLYSILPTQETQANTTNSTQTQQSFTYTPATFTDFLESDLAEYINTQISGASSAQQTAIKATTEKAISDIQSTLESNEKELNKMAAEAYIQSQQNQDNLALKSAANGDYGGIAQKEYSDAKASYDQQLLAINLQYEALKSEANNKIAELEAEGQYQAAQAVSDWASKKLDVIISTYEWTAAQALQLEQFDYQQYINDRNYELSLAQLDAQTRDTNTTASATDSDYEPVTQTPKKDNDSNTTLASDVGFTVYDSGNGMLIGAYYDDNGVWFDANGNKLTGIITLVDANGNERKWNCDTQSEVKQSTTEAIYGNNPAYNDADMKSSGKNIYSGMFKLINYKSGEGLMLFNGNNDKEKIYNSVQGMNQEDYNEAKTRLENACYATLPNISGDKGYLFSMSDKALSADDIAYYYTLCNELANGKIQPGDIVTTLKSDLKRGILSESTAEILRNAFNISYSAWMMKK